MVFGVVVLCGLAVGLLGRALAGPERWYRKVRSQVRPDASEPTRSGYMLLFWWNWLVAVVALVVAGFGFDRIQLTETELYDASSRAAGVLDGTTGHVTAARLEAAIEDVVHAKVTAERITSDSTEADKPKRYEITKEMKSSDDVATAAACVEVSTHETKHDSGVWYSYLYLSHGKCPR